MAVRSLQHLGKTTHLLLCVSLGTVGCHEPNRRLQTLVCRLPLVWSTAHAGIVVYQDESILSRLQSEIGLLLSTEEQQRLLSQ